MVLQQPKTFETVEVSTKLLKTTTHFVSNKLSYFKKCVKSYHEYRSFLVVYLSFNYFLFMNTIEDT